LDAVLQRIEADRLKAEAVGCRFEELVAMRIVDQMLARVVDCRLVRALTTEVMAQVKGPDDLVENLCVTFRGSRHECRLQRDRIYHIPAGCPAARSGRNLRSRGRWR